MDIPKIRPNFTRPSSWCRFRPPTGSLSAVSPGVGVVPGCSETRRAEGPVPQQEMPSEAAQERTGDIGTSVAAELADELDAVVEGATDLRPGSGVLVVKRGPNAGSRFPLNKPLLTAGRLPDSDIFLDDITVSRRHAEFRSESGQFSVTDLGSLNRTYLNRQPVESAVLTNGDEIQIGRVRLIFLTSA